MQTRIKYLNSFAQNAKGRVLKVRSGSLRPDQLSCAGPCSILAGVSDEVGASLKRRHRTMFRYDDFDIVDLPIMLVKVSDVFGRTFVDDRSVPEP